MEFGLKLWSSNTNIINEAIHLIHEKIFDYIELTVVPNTSISLFEANVPYIIHVPHEKFGVNIGDVIKKDYNLRVIHESIEWANKLNAKHIIIHPGYGSMQHATDMLREISDSRLLIENMPKVGLDGEAMIGYSPAQIEELIGDSNMGLCLDFGHAVKAAVSLGADYKEYVQEFMEFNPKVFHLSDGMLNNEFDEHLKIGQGEYDFNFILKNIDLNPGKSKYCTIETPLTNLNNLNEHIWNKRELEK